MKSKELMNNICVVHYSEIAIKGGNRIFFEKQLINNIKRALEPHRFDKIRRLRGRIVIFLASDVDETEIEVRLQHVFGIAVFSFGRVVPANLKVIKSVGWEMMRNMEFESYRITTKRGQKEFPQNSVQINHEVGAYVEEKSGKRVDLKNPEATLFIEITEQGALLYTKKIQGLRGLPVGSSERAVSLLSSGIDSPVASYLMLKRGVQVIYAHFHSQPFTSRASQENTEKLVQVLSRYQYYSKVYFVPFIDIQKEIMAKSPARLRVLLYRRYMVRLSERIAWEEKARALITGENVGQVASQTLSNIRVVAEVTPLPILRPLAGFDKEEIIQKAQSIGTFEISIAPYEDCCSLFVPDKPATKALPRSLAEAELQLDMKAMLDDAMARAEVKTYNWPAKETGATS